MHIDSLLQLKGDFQRIADEAMTKPVWLYHIAKGYRRASPEMALRIERATSGAVTRADLRPDLFEPEQAKAAA